VPIGIGTQRVADYLKERFPTTPLLRLDRDAISRKNALAHALASIAHGEVSLIIGTQLLAKGHHFPRLTLVVVLDADNGFYNTDFRALEHLGQLLTQVAGRAGRAEAPGQVLIQTHLPHHPLLNQLVQFGYDAFAESLLKTRQEAELPPYAFVALIRAESRSLPTLLQCMHAMKTHLSPDIHVLGPAPAPLGRKAHFHRMQLLVKSTSRKALGHALSALREWLLTQDLDRGVRWHIDVDPIELS
jgi:primosomal protein N' (replication factor Y)